MEKTQKGIVLTMDVFGAMLEIEISLETAEKDKNGNA